MRSQNVKITKLYYAVDGTKEAFEQDFSAEDFEELPLFGKVEASGELMRVEEGIALLLETLKATQLDHCSRCDKILKIELEFTPSEWLFYEEKTGVREEALSEEDNSYERLFLDKKQMEINTYEVIRQELLLNLNLASHCEKICKKFIAPKEELKPLFGLKDLFHEN